MLLPAIIQQLGYSSFQLFQSFSWWSHGMSPGVKWLAASWQSRFVLSSYPCFIAEHNSCQKILLSASLLIWRQRHSFLWFRKKSHQVNCQAFATELSILAISFVCDSSSNKSTPLLTLELCAMVTYSMDFFNIYLALISVLVSSSENLFYFA